MLSDWEEGRKMDNKQGVLEGQEASTTNELSEKSYHVLPITAEWINKSAHANCSHASCVSVRRVCGHFCISYLLPACFFFSFLFFFFLRCLYNPATMEIWKARGHLFHPVGGSTHTYKHTQPMSRASCDVCHIEDGITARVGASCDAGERGQTTSLWVFPPNYETKPKKKKKTNKPINHVKRWVRLSFPGSVKVKTLMTPGRLGLSISKLMFSLQKTNLCSCLVSPGTFRNLSSVTPSLSL